MLNPFNGEKAFKPEAESGYERRAGRLSDKKKADK